MACPAKTVCVPSVTITGESYRLREKRRAGVFNVSGTPLEQAAT